MVIQISFLSQRTLISNSGDRKNRARDIKQLAWGSFWVLFLLYSLLLMLKLYLRKLELKKFQNIEEKDLMKNMELIEPKWQVILINLIKYIELVKKLKLKNTIDSVNLANSFTNEKKWKMNQMNKRIWNKLNPKWARLNTLNKRKTKKDFKLKKHKVKDILN